MVCKNLADCAESLFPDSLIAISALESGMTHIQGHDRSQLLLLPEAVDDYVGADNPVRFIDAFVDGLDLQAAGFIRVEAKATGRPGYAPADLGRVPDARPGKGPRRVQPDRPRL